MQAKALKLRVVVFFNSISLVVFAIVRRHKGIFITGDSPVFPRACPRSQISVRNLPWMEREKSVV